MALTVDQEALTELARLDGCYALRTDLPKAVDRKGVVHDRYKDLAQVEWAFRDSKSVHLEMRPVYLRAENRTRGHAVVVMLAYLMAQELRRRWRDIDLTVQGRPRPPRQPVRHRSPHRRTTFLPSGSDAARRRPPIVRSRQHRHPHRAAARPGPSSHQEKTPTTPKSEINSTRYRRLATHRRRGTSVPTKCGRCRALTFEPWHGGAGRCGVVRKPDRDRRR